MLDTIGGESLIAGRATASLRVNLSVVSIEAVLKTCYWFSRDFLCAVQDEGTGNAIIQFQPKQGVDTTVEKAREAFFTQALDFSLRERVTAKTAGIRDLLLAKAFSEAGVLEDEPSGVFGDGIEEAKPDGLFKILGNN
jgi:His-Xaa-Ser system protein HxsD